LSYRLRKVNDIYWGFKSVFSYSKPHTYPTFIGEEKNEIIVFLYPGHFEYKQNESKVNGRHILKEREEKENH